MPYTNTLRQLLNAPLAIEPQALKMVIDYLNTREGFNLELPELAHPKADVSYPDFREKKPYRVTEEGVAVVPIIGELIYRKMRVEGRSGLRSYQGIEAEVREALEDTDVRSILFEIESPGGTVAGLDDLVSFLRSAGREKPIWSAVPSYAYSAAYEIAANTERIYMAGSAMVGSIGVIGLHADWSKSLEKRGIKVTAIFAGAKKNDLTPYEPLQDRAKAEYQEKVNKFYDWFVASVASGRGISEEAVRATEAGIFLGQDAVDINLADGIAGIEKVLSMLGGVSRPDFSTGGLAAQTEEARMSKKDEKGREPKESKAQEETPDLAAKEKAARAEGRKAEQARIKAITGCEEAQGRKGLAEHLAYETDMEPEAARKALAAAPREDTGQNDPAGFKAHMEAIGNPDVGPDAGSKPDDVQATVRRIIDAGKVGGAR